MIRYLVAFLIGLSLFLTNLLLKIDMNSFSYLINYIDGLFIGGAVLICISGLSFVSYLGAFDIFSYIAGGKRKHHDCTLYDYSEIQKNQKKNKGGQSFFKPYLIVGIVFVLIALILMAFM